MNVSDPLADVAPPRYAIESDDEDEDERHLGRSEASRCNVTVEITFKTQSSAQEELEKHVPLIVASGQAGNVLARLLGRPSISSRVYANSTEIGYFVQLQITPESKYTILISESDSSQGILTLASMHPYAQRVIDELKPSRVSILDTYSRSTYASSELPRAAYDSPVRHLLGTLSKDTADVTDRLKEIFDTTSSNIQLEPFSPPNLVHSTSAAFMNVSALLSNAANNGRQNSTVLMLLMPSPHIGLLPSMRPRYLGEVDKADEAEQPRIGNLPRTDYYSEEDVLPWSNEMLQRVVKGLFVSVEGPVGSGDVERELERLLRLNCGSEVTTAELKKGKGRRHLGEVGENSMYI